MKSKQIHDTPKTFAIVFQAGDEASAGLLEFARSNGIVSAHFTAIGALEHCTLGYFDWQKKDYQHIPIHDQVEVLSLVGNIAEQDGKPKLHAHLVVGMRDGTAHGGHLIKAKVRPTLELVLAESPKHLKRKFDPASGLALIDPQA